MHPSVLTFARTHLTPEVTRGKYILESGSFNVNGSIREVFRGHDVAKYIGTDSRPGPDVDVVCDAINLPRYYGPGLCTDTIEHYEAHGKMLKGQRWIDIVISTEMLEHAPNWKLALSGMWDILRIGGHLLLTTRSPGFPLHDFPTDHWRFTREQFAACFHNNTSNLIIENDPEAPGVFVFCTKSRDVISFPVEAIPMEGNHGTNRV